LLQLLGNPLNENDKITDLEFLSEMMEAQEDLASCDKAALRAHDTLNRDRIQQQHALASQAFSCNRISDAKAAVIKLQCNTLLHAFCFCFASSCATLACRPPAVSVPSFVFSCLC
jgi:hypothetical protein